MPINLQSTANFWARIKGDSATAGDGTSNTSPARYDSWNSDLGSQDDTAATSDSGTFSFIALFKRVIATGLRVQPFAYTFTDRSSNTGATPNTYVQVMASNSSRRKWFIQNPPSNTSNITISFGASGSEIAIADLQPGDSTSDRDTLIYQGRISAKSSGTSVVFYAHEV